MCPNLSWLEIDTTVNSLTLGAPDKLETLYLLSNTMEALDLSACTNMNDIMIGGSDTLRSLTLTSEALEYLCLYDLPVFSGLDVSCYPQLVCLDLENLPLVTSLDLSNCELMDELALSYMSLTGLDLSRCTQLTYLSLYEMTLPSLDLSACSQLTNLYLTDTSLSSLDLSSCAQLRQVSLTSMPLTNLDLSSCGQIRYLSVKDTPLFSLDLSPDVTISAENSNGLDSCSLNCTLTMPAGPFTLSDLGMNEAQAARVTDLTSVVQDNNQTFLTGSTFSYAYQTGSQNNAVLNVCVNVTWETPFDPVTGYCPDVSRYADVPPTLDDHVFLGWYADAARLKPTTADAGMAFARFLDADVLSADRSLVLPASLAAIDEETFVASAFRRVVCGSYVTEIGARAFADCASLALIEIPNPSTTIDATAFEGCGEIVIVTCPGSAAEAFANANGLPVVLK